MCLHATNVKHFGRRRGPAAAFTLIELLVVVAIISLLMSILLPSLSKARESARCVKCSTNLRSILQGAHSYLSTYDRFVHPQLFPQQLGDLEFYFDSGKTLRGESIIGGSEESHVWDCPNAVKQRTTWTDPERQGWDARYEFMSYGANDWGLGEVGYDTDEKANVLTGMLDSVDPSDSGPAAWWGVRDNEVVQPAKFICFGESNRDGSWDQVIAQCMKDHCWFDTGETPGAIHAKNKLWGINVGFFDGHVQWYPTFTYPEFDVTNSQRQVAGIMISDAPRRFYPDDVRAPWRRMWSRDFKPHVGIKND
jgi:prepilin-type N-terminal cleavage/methylation domain-containing protein/prepilin-type processing-associated H-X9-DG protein